MTDDVKAAAKAAAATAPALTPEQADKLRALLQGGVA